MDPFDPTRASYPLRRLAVCEVIDLLHVSHAPEVVAVYRDQMLAGDRFPPVSVIRLARRFVIADGHKRFAAYRALGGADILVEVWSYRRFLRDQWRQAAGNGRKNLRIVQLCASDPAGALQLLGTTLRHWRRVATALATRRTSS